MAKQDDVQDGGDDPQIREQGVPLPLGDSFAGRTWSG